MTTHIGLIGGGNISETHARAARAIADVEIAAVFGTNAEKVGRLCREYGGKPYSNFDEFLAHRPMELVAIGSPSGLHAEHGIAAARRGLHVLTEKPIDITVERADALIAETRKARVRLGVFFQDQGKPDILSVKNAVDAGVLGKPILADARVKWYRPPEYFAKSRWRGTWGLDGGGALINQAVHTLDLMLWIFGDVKAVQANCKTALHAIEVEDTLVAMLEFANGALGVLQADTSVFPGYPRRLELTGSQGTLIIEQDRLLAADLRNPPADLLKSSEADKNPSASSPVVSDARGHQAILEDFLRAIRTNTKPRCDGQEGRRSLVLVQAIYEACRTGRRVVMEVTENR
ncbi:MAG: UDP-N-acetyl-2-amino-2-deoxyglucuronate dehydrogenase [Acidobacteriaceae bacterium]|jgi:UDP-N-acetyl-2-amino-2-deoxyglucuronate dehydrogenase|nr:UDP-N-acetyl-2-amino-2-deoxyglucuronate dehydrogenase [Acidobacteriaceae bacterium]